jgi:hypothetical protein
MLSYAKLHLGSGRESGQKQPTLLFSGSIPWFLKLVREDLPTMCFTIEDEMQYADFEEAQEEAILCHSRRGLTRESIMTHS